VNLYDAESQNLYYAVYASRLRKVLKSHRKLSNERLGARTVWGSKLQVIRPATEKLRRPNIERPWRGTNNWWPLVDRRCCRRVMSDSGNALQRIRDGRTDCYVSLALWIAVLCWLAIKKNNKILVV